MKLIIKDKSSILLCLTHDQTIDLPIVDSIEQAIELFKGFTILKMTMFENEFIEIIVSHLEDKDIYIAIKFDAVLYVVGQYFKNLDLYDILLQYFRESNEIEKIPTLINSKKNRVILRGEILVEDEYIQLVVCWIKVQNQFLIIERANDDSSPLWSSVTGIQNMSDDHFIDAGIREVKEELNVALSPMNLKKQSIDKQDSVAICHLLFELDKAPTEITVNRDEVVNYQFVALNELENYMTIDLIPEIIK